MAVGNERSDVKSLQRRSATRVQQRKPSGRLGRRTTMSDDSKKLPVPLSLCICERKSEKPRCSTGSQKMLGFLLPYRLPIIHLHNMNTRNISFHLYSLVFLSSTCNLTPTRGLKFCQKILTPLASILCFYTDVISQERERNL